MNFTENLKLYKWEAKDTKLSTFEEFNKNADIIETQFKHSLNGKKVFSIAAFQRQVPEGNDLGRFQRAIAAAENDSILNLTDEAVFEVSSTLTIDKKLHLFGKGTEIKTVTDGLDSIFSISNQDGFTISGIKFNQNLKGRTSITLSACTNFVIDHCSFTGYSKEYAYANTDGGIKMTGCVRGKILFCDWKDHGNQYTEATADLNRCITIQGTSDLITMMGNKFNNVNQACVIQSGNHIFVGNELDSVKDNSLYLLAVDSIVISGNSFNDKFDECIVMAGKRITITGNVFKNAPNKVLAINGNVNGLIINNNHFDNTDVTTGKFISWRDATYQVDHLVCMGNVFSHPNMSQTATEFFEIGNVSNLKFTDNTINVKTAASQRMLYFKGTTAKGTVADNTFIGTIDSSLTIEVAATVTDYDLLYENNKHTLCRGLFSEKITLNRQGVRHDIGPYIESVPVVSHVYSSTMPTKGTWKKGSVVWNTGNDYNVLCWRRATDGSGHVLGTDWIAK